ncbi:DUF6053 domain-containing protein [Lysobacter enzymogenes]|uniref:DUF6053 domain-containing protein n=1 Tax=Lysobacter enzymogenes TaxID=69 RepID=UPI0033908BC9
MGGPSGPMLVDRVAATWNKSLGPEGPATTSPPITASADPRPAGSPFSDRGARPRR